VQTQSDSFIVVNLHEALFLHGFGSHADLRALVVVDFGALVDLGVVVLFLSDGLNKNASVSNVLTVNTKIKVIKVFLIFFLKNYRFFFVVEENNVLF
jgi:hypothetical protein